MKINEWHLASFKSERWEHREQCKRETQDQCKWMKVIKMKVKKQRKRKRRTKQWKGKMMKKYKELLIKWTQPTLLLLLFLYFLSVILLVIRINQQEKTMKMWYQLNQLFLRFSFSSKQNFYYFFHWFKT